MDALVKTTLTHLSDCRATFTISRSWKSVLRKFLKSVGMAMNGDSQAAITELLKRVEEE